MVLLPADFKKNKTFMNTIRVSNSLDPDQDRHILLFLIWVLAVFKGYQQTKSHASKETVFCFYSQHLYKFEKDLPKTVEVA